MPALGAGICFVFGAAFFGAAFFFGAAAFFAGNMEKSRCFLKEHGYIPKMLEKSRFNRRQHRIAELFLTVFELLGSIWKELNENSIYILDSFPVAACDNYRIQRSRRYSGEEWRGYQASKHRYFRFNLTLATTRLISGPINCQCQQLTITLLLKRQVAR